MAFRIGEDSFHLSEETRRQIHRSRSNLDEDESDCLASGTLIDSIGSATPKTPNRRLLQCAKTYKTWTDWSGFKPDPPKVATKHMYNIDGGKWVQEKVLIEIDHNPFGKGALRECFRMREVSLDGEGSPAVYSKAVQQIHDSSKSKCWVGKRSMSDHNDLTKHLQDCLADAALQQMAKHYGELFDAAVRNKRHDNTPLPNNCEIHEVDFLMAHVIELEDGSSYGVEAYVFGDYQKHNNNSGAVLGKRRTPQAFSYFSFVQSGYRLIIVDIQGVNTLFTDPVLHFLPKHNPDLAAFGDQSVNLGIRGMALFLRSHKDNPIDDFLGFPIFEHARGDASITGSATCTDQGFRRTDADIALASVPGIDLNLSSWSNVEAAVCDQGLPLHLVPAACHMEIAVMYHEHRIGEADVLTETVAHAALFHLVEAARLGLPEAMLGLARLCSGMSHEDFFPTVHSEPEHCQLCILLLERVAKSPEGIVRVPWVQAARGALAQFLSTGSFGKKDAVSAAQLFELFAEAEMSESALEPTIHELGLDVSSKYGATFGWENHGLETHSAFAKAAEIHNARRGAKAKVVAKRLWEAASECALADPRLAKMAMRFIERAEAVEVNDEEDYDAGEEAEPQLDTTMHTVQVHQKPTDAVMTNGVGHGLSRRLRVELTDQSGKPIKDVEVAIWNMDSNTRVSNVVKTDSKGVARFCLQDEGRELAFRMTKDGYQANERSLPNAKRC